MNKTTLLGGFVLSVTGLAAWAAVTLPSAARSSGGVGPAVTPATGGASLPSSPDAELAVTGEDARRSTAEPVVPVAGAPPQRAAVADGAELHDEDPMPAEMRARVARRLGVLETQPEAVDRTILLHRAATPQEKVDALRRLDAHSFMHGVEVLDGAAVDEVRWLLGHIQEPDLKELALQGLEHYRGKDLLAPVVAILRDDPHAGTRRQAADMLREHLDQRHVYDALVRAARDDEDPEVRREASLTR